MFKNELRETRWAKGPSVVVFSILTSNFRSRSHEMSHVESDQTRRDIAVSAGVGAWKTRGRASTAAAPTGSCASVERAGAIVAVLAAADDDAIGREQRHSCTPSFPRTL